MSQAAINIHNYDNEKKISLRKNKRTYFGGILLLFSVLLVVFISSWEILRWITDAQYLPMLQIILTGERNYTQNDDILRLILELGSPGAFMVQNVNMIQNQIKSLPWIKQANIRKQWPDKLIIHIIEYVPVAHWNDHYMVDIDGNSFRIPNNYNNQQDLPKLYGPKGCNNEVFQRFQEMEKVLAKNFFILKEVAMTARHSWKLTLTNGIKLNLGCNDIMKRLSRFIELYPILQNRAQINGKWINYVDLRYNSGAAIGWWKADPIKEPNKTH